ncbi:MAG: RNA polymerase factor sigma-54 [Kiritimatiellae bacterium]|nr:RNA polymerase factor sigma-54 [Kiritimatiellia bacterium]MDW8459387.1 RNA polymerase factor sigma-54 [Verrucomicrobiota bacterium]
MAQPFISLTQQQRLHMTLAPQLRQSLELLQAPTLELRALVRQEVEQNPTLEEQPIEDAEPLEVEPAVNQQVEAETGIADEFEKLARLDEEWRDYFHLNQSMPRYSSEDAERRQFFFDSLSQPISLQQHLMNQLALTGLSEEERRIGELLIGSINDDGYLAVPLDELALTAGASPAELERVLGIIQEFDPIGVGARDLKECLLIQLRRLGKEDSLASELVRGHLDNLGARRYAEIARALQCSPEEVQSAARLIATLEPKPGRAFAPESPAYVTPDVIVAKVNGEYIVILNNDQIPRLHISEHYRQLMNDEQTPPDVKSYIREKIRAGLFLIKSISQRQQTIYNIAKEIVAVQRDFFEHGVTHLRPLTMAQVASALGIHETTVSRAISNKYMQTPRGTFEMKYFFTPGYVTADGQAVSNKAIKDAIAKMIAEEDPAHPLSDQDIAKRLAEQGFSVARRTVAKYRDELKILPSHLRKGVSP